MSRRSDRWRDNVGRDDGKTGGAEWNNVEIGGIYRARYWKELVDTMGTFSGIVGREEGSDGKDERARAGRIVLVHRRVPATNRGCIIHSLGYTRTGIALRPLCVCVVSEQYRHVKVARPRRMRFTSKLPRLQPGYRGLHARAFTWILSPSRINR